MSGKGNLAPVDARFFPNVKYHFHLVMMMIIFLRLSTAEDARCYRHAKQQQQQQQHHPSFVYKLKCQQKVDCDALANALLRHLVSHYTKAPCVVLNLGCLWNSGQPKDHQSRPASGGPLRSRNAVIAVTFFRRLDGS
jgi:hypothetical protein